MIDVITLMIDEALIGAIIVQGLSRPIVGCPVVKVAEIYTRYTRVLTFGFGEFMNFEIWKGAVSV